MATNALAIGNRIGQYELREVIGEGGMGTVFGAVDTKRGVTVAVKVLTPPEGSKPEIVEQLRQRFLREILAVSRITHPNVVKVNDWGFAEGDRPYLVMDLLHGKDLLTRLRESKAPLPIDYAADIILEVCAALRACHERGVLHRDLKPGNIFLATTETGAGFEVKVLDFGVSKAPLTGADITTHGQIIGTWHYLSPEQVRGKAFEQSDQYAIAVMLYNCLTKVLPYQGLDGPPLLRAIEKGEFPTPRTRRPEIPEGLEKAILRGMHLSHEARFESVYAFGQAVYPFASRAGREKWKKFYLHSPVLPVLPRQYTAEIPTEMMKRLGLADDTEVDDGAPTEPAHYHSATAKLEGDPRLLSPNPDLLIPTRPPDPPSQLEASAQSRDHDKKAYYHAKAERSAAGVAPDESRAAMSGEIDVHLTTGSSGVSTANVKRRRRMVALVGGGLLVASGLLVFVLHRPQERLIRPASFQPPAAVLPPSQQQLPAPTVLPPPKPVTVPPTPPAPSEEAAAASTKPAAEIGARKKRRRPHPRDEMETTPDGVLLVR
jgi:serine/threonine-protein kinase